MSRYVFPLDAGAAEYVFAPFFDPEHAPGLALEFEAPSGFTLERENDWCFTKVIWNGVNSRQSEMTVRCQTPFASEVHDRLIAAFTLSPTACVSFALLDGKGRVLGGWSKAFQGTGIRQEIDLSLTGLLLKGLAPRALLLAAGLRQRSFAGVALRISSPQASEGVLVLTWLGLRNSKAHAELTRSRAGASMDWSPWVLTERDRGEMVPQHGLLFGREELFQVRGRRFLPGWREHFAVLESKAMKCLELTPEKDYGEYLPHHDLRFTRVRAEAVRAYHWDALVLAFVGLVTEEKRYIEHALRYLMCMLHTPQWGDSSEQRVPSSTWTQRAFMEEMTTTSVAILLDWLGFALSGQAQSLARHALWTRGMSYVQRDLFQHDYMQRMNQGAVFCRALVLGGLTLERGWPRAAGVADDAYMQMRRVLQSYVQSDGGISEGPGYFCQTLTATLWTIIAYCRARHLDWRLEVQSLYPDIENYLTAMAAGEPGKCIPSGDCRLEWFSGDAIPIFAALFPDSAFASILKPCLENGWVHEVTGTLRGSGGMVGMVYGPDEVKMPSSVAAPSSWLPKTGKLSHVREVAGHVARLWATASRYGVTHGHLDHGGVVLEVDETPLFVDRGMAEYWKASLVHEMRRSYAHNTLTPLLADGRYADQVMPGPDAKEPTVPSDGSALLEIPGQDVWRNHMSAYVRTLVDGGADATWYIRDRGVLLAPGRLAFHFHGPHKFSVSGTSVNATVGDFYCQIDFPWAEQVTVELSLPDFAGRAMFHICALTGQCESFDLETRITVRGCIKENGV
ncbi:hypothetical protein GRF61_05335 [Azoarcus sp. TTM-91]|uniref:heparinase II/III domain-containing protein n=1 Tax=Azoarcus sp. TTM-91 TaxID=2691581 RepID=UPI00145F6C93|nr:heparinase II/III family protein [Azoarcus sp. TTM-91]NMG33873.1 hypothetical protein [Azoarcus sp. TTM-91]